MSAIFIPRDVRLGKYAGGLEQPIDWKVNRQIGVKRTPEGGVAIAVAGVKLAPQDHDALMLFEQMYGAGPFSLFYDGQCVRLLMNKSTLHSAMTELDLLGLVVETYKMIEARQTDYTEDARNRLYKHGYVIEKHVGEEAMKPAEYDDTFDKMVYERAPDVFVRPNHPL